MMMVLQHQGWLPIGLNSIIRDAEGKTMSERVLLNSSHLITFEDLNTALLDCGMRMIVRRDVFAESVPLSDQHEFPDEGKRFH